jgi:hypothetical protein
MNRPRTRRAANTWMADWLQPEQQYGREAELLAWEAFSHRLQAESSAPKWVGVPRVLPTGAAPWI